MLIWHQNGQKIPQCKLENGQLRINRIKAGVCTRWELAMRAPRVDCSANERCINPGINTLTEYALKGIMECVGWVVEIGEEFEPEFGALDEGVREEILILLKNPKNTSTGSA